jgi:TRAP-type C4-dicarboxylate transport system substrate-binding protein
MLQTIADEIGRMSGGRVKFTLYFGGSLFSTREALRAILSGQAFLYNTYVPKEDPGLMVLNSFPQIPFMGFPSDFQKATMVFREVFENTPELQNEYQGLKVFYPTIYSFSQYVNTTKRPVTTSEDLKGLKVISDGYDAKWMSAMGAIPVNIAFPDMYLSMEKGVVEATFNPPLIVPGMLNLYRYHLHLPIPFEVSFDCTIINPEMFNKLPADIQKMFYDLTDSYTEKRIRVQQEQEDAAVQQCRDLGHTFAEISPETLKQWTDVAETIHQLWVKDAEGKGKAGKAFYDYLQQTIAKYK